MSNINQNKDDNEAGKEEVKENNGQSQVLDMIRFDANAVSQQSAHLNARNSDDMTLNSGESSSSRKRKYNLNGKHPYFCEYISTIGTILEIIFYMNYR